jgi:hypothetical protein
MRPVAVSQGGWSSGKTRPCAAEVILFKLYDGFLASSFLKKAGVTLGVTPRGQMLMAKKKRTAKRSTKASTRPPTTKRVAAKGKGGAFQTGAFQGVPPSVSQRKLGPAVQSTQGVIEPPHAPIEGRLDIREQADSLIAEGVVIPPPVPITPTNYPDSPQGTVNVQNHITINIQSEEFSRFNKTLKR